MEEVIKVGIGKVREVESGILSEVVDEEIEEGDGAVERIGRGLDGPLLSVFGGFCGSGSF